MISNFLYENINFIMDVKEQINVLLNTIICVLSNTNEILIDIGC